MEYREAYSQEGHSGGTSYGVKILVKIGRDLTENDHYLLSGKGTEIAEGILQESIALDPNSKDRAHRERIEILGLFPDPIFAEEIPNGYCSRYCCKHLPWFVVTTHAGRIKIGWRKSVINIDWSDSIIRDAARNLFPNEDVTKSEKYIHAWGYEKAAEYIMVLLNAPRNR